MFSGGCFPGVETVVSGLAGGLTGGCGGGDEQQQPMGTMLDKNKKLALALMKAQLGRKLNLPMRPNLPQFSVNPAQGTGSTSLADSLAKTKYGGA